MYFPLVPAREGRNQKVINGELTQFCFCPRHRSLCMQYWPVSPLFPSSSILRTHTHKTTRNTLGSSLLRTHQLLPDHYSVSILICSTQVDWTFPCPLPARCLSVPAALPAPGIPCLFVRRTRAPHRRALWYACHQQADSGRLCKTRMQKEKNAKGVWGKW